MAKYCINCGKQLDDNQQFCPSCGVQQNFQQTSMPTNSQPQGKSKLVAGLLGVSLGCFGIHSFYLGYTGRGIAQIILSIFTCGFGGWLWGLIEGIQIFTGNINVDADGNPLVD